MRIFLNENVLCFCGVEGGWGGGEERRTCTYSGLFWTGLLTNVDLNGFRLSSLAPILNRMLFSILSSLNVIMVSCIS